MPPNATRRLSCDEALGQREKRTLKNCPTTPEPDFADRAADLSTARAVGRYAVLAALLFAGLARAQDPIETVRAFRIENEARILREFVEFLEIPNVSSDAPNIRRNAEYIRKALGKRGIKAELFEIEGASPVVFAEIKTPGATRTLGIYVHYDGQPVDTARWTNPPFKPALYTAAIENGGVRRPMPKPGEPTDPEWRLYARASGDDKAPIIAALAALDALRAADIALTANIKFFFEGEEEIGSPHLAEFLKKYRDRIDVDAWIIMDGPGHQSRRPQLVFGVRGITGFDITVYGATRYLHSGHYGNWAPNPAMMLAQLLATMKNDAGRVLIDGFYDTVEPLTSEGKRALAAVPKIGEAMRNELGLRETEASNAPYVQRLLLPSLNVRGLVSATVGKTARNVIPNTATASIDIRLVSGNDPEAMLDLVESHIRRQGYKIVREEPDRETRRAYSKIAKVTRHGGYKAARTSMSIPIVKEIVRAASRAAGEPIIQLPTLGGSLPLYLFTDDLQKPTVIAPIANHDNNQHAPDENIRLGNLWYGIDLIAAIFTMPP